MNQTKKDKFAFSVRRMLHEHQQMLSDGMRNELLYKVLRQKISKETRFLDIGAGTGVWAVLAAFLGAKRIVAVEIEECLIPIIHQFAKENGVADKIEIIHANADDLKLSEEFDIIVSELFGYDAYGEKTINSFVKLRERYLAENGVLIPQKMEKYAVPVRIKDTVEKVGDKLPLKSNFFRSLKLNYYENISIAERDKIAFLAEPKKLLGVDLRNIKEPPNLKDLSQKWRLENLSEVNAFAVYNHLFYSDEIELDTFKSKSWAVGVYEFQPFAEQRSGEIKFEITLKKEQIHWKIDLPSHPELKPQSYSPGFGVARVLMAQSSTPHLKFP